MKDIIEINGIPYRRVIDNFCSCKGCFLRNSPYCDLRYCIDFNNQYILIPEEI